MNPSGRKELRSLGICLGASTVSAVVVGSRGREVLHTHREGHEGAPQEVLGRVLEDGSLQPFARIAVTGRKLRESVRLSTLSEPEAVEWAMRAVGTVGIDAVVSAGGETFLLYRLDRQGRITAVHSGNKCASGTGEFFLQQIGRMNLGVEQALEQARQAAPYRVSGRCSVFCKSDCTHALNRGESIGSICSGLCLMMAEKILELLAGKGIRRIILIGGTSSNQVMVEQLRQELEEVLVPPQADCFEAYGAALWALEHGARPLDEPGRLFRAEGGSFRCLPPLAAAARRVEFRQLPEDRPGNQDQCILGLDVGSTTTKAVLVRLEDDALLGSVYLRTGGDPVAAARSCYAALGRALEAPVRIVGLGVTGSGRQIAGLHARTDGVINEIIAHATASLYLDPEVDTIFEIGGQDAKYTYITGGVPSDYAMNEACSAGTGSFLEEAAGQSFGIDYRQIEPLALQARRPPNFSDQCAAFINSDIKTALQEGVSREDVIAGLVYSICANYLNKVRGARPVGRKIFMQGGVCYNRAVPIAMAGLLGREIVVPPHPGLMGAFGVALELKQRRELGLVERREFSLGELAAREIELVRTFGCNGGREGCDRKCEIRVLKVDGQTHPFGGACNRYYNLRDGGGRKTRSRRGLDLVRERQQLVFGGFWETRSSDSGEADVNGPVPVNQAATPACAAGARSGRAGRSEGVSRGEGGVRAVRRGLGTVGINRSFLVHSYLPLFRTFFSALGLRVVLPDRLRPDGINRKGAAFCYPCELAHGFCADLLDKRPDCLFLPHLQEIEGRGEASYKSCLFVQGEGYLLREAFGIRTEELPILAPVLNFRRGIESQRRQFVQLGRRLGASARQGASAFVQALAAQRTLERESALLGRRFLDELGEDEIAIVLFGRCYNAFAGEANLGIPGKFASRGVRIVPYDVLPFDDSLIERSMYWGQGRRILAAARVVKDHPNLFGVYITNFSCGPDSFLLSYFRQIMDHKPSLTLELDTHTADAGVDTRIEALLDIARRYRELERRGVTRKTAGGNRPFRPAAIESHGGELVVRSSAQGVLRLTDPQVRVLLPSMGELNVQVLAAVLRRAGIDAVALSPPDVECLRTGRKHTSCKECLPLQLTTGSFLHYLRERRDKGEVTVFFMPGTDGPCRFGQYHVYLRHLIREQRLENAAVLSLSTASGYSEMPAVFKTIRVFWQGCIAAGLMEEARSVLRVLAADREQALRVHGEAWAEFLGSLEQGPAGGVQGAVGRLARRLSGIPLRRPLSEARYVALVGEIYVRQDGFCQGEIVSYLESRGFVVRVAPAEEWFYYLAYLFQRGALGAEVGPLRRLQLRLLLGAMQHLEGRTKRRFARCGLVEPELVDIHRTIGIGEALMSPELYGEAILTVGLSLREILSRACGVISIGPFGCMPSRFAEALLATGMFARRLPELGRSDAGGCGDLDALPFLAVETDGNPLPPLVRARLEAFCLQAERVHSQMTVYSDRSAGLS